MNTNEKLTEVLNDLITINNDRSEGYINAAKEVKSLDVDLQATFGKMADDSKEHAAQLTKEVQRLGGEATTGTSGTSKIHRAWMDIKATFTGKDRQAILDSCEFGEDAAQKAYRDALASDAEMSAETRNIITDQQASLKKSHDMIKKYRDVNKAVHA
jgi:uncharacterized protein (TIGR02284 family)